MSQLKGNMVIAQGGGPTAVINQSLVGAILEARKMPQIERIYGALHGVSGIKDEKFVDLTQTTTAHLEAIAQTPSSALRSTRDKPDDEYCQKMFEVMQKYNIRYFFYIGGNDSSETVRIIEEKSRETGYELRAIHIPKTIDNDLMVTDHTPGFGSAARFVSQAFAGVNLDNLSIPGIYLGVVMGRSSGFLAASSILAHRYNDDAPHLVYLPERRFDVDRFLDDVQKRYDEMGRCVISLSEGIWSEKDEKGHHKPMIATLYERKGEDVPRDPFGHPQLSGGVLADTLVALLRDKIGVKRIRGDTFGYLQRSFLGCVSSVDQQEARDVGEKAIQFAMSGSGSVCIRRIGHYAVNYFLETDLSKIAAKTKVIPDAWINKEGNGMTEDFRRYATPLIGQPLLPELLQAPPVLTK